MEKKEKMSYIGGINMVPDGKRIYHGNLNDYMINTTKKTFKTI